jgi:hypothetical protein
MTSSQPACGQGRPDHEAMFLNGAECVRRTGGVIPANITVERGDPSPVRAQENNPRIAGEEHYRRNDPIHRYSSIRSGRSIRVDRSGRGVAPLVFLQRSGKFRVQVRPGNVVRRRKGTDNDIRARSHGRQQVVARGFQPASNEVAPHGAADILRHDEPKTRGNPIGIPAQIGHQVWANDPHTTANDHLVVVTVGDAIGPREHESA